MKNRNIGFGIFLLVVGIFWVLMNTGVVDWSIIDTLFTLWPLVLVVIGINMIFNGRPIIKVVAWLLFVGVLVGYGYYQNGTGRNIRAEGTEGGSVIIQKAQETETAKLSAALGGMKLRLDAATEDLLNATVNNPYFNYTDKYSDGKKKAEISLNERRYVKWENHGISYDGTFHLNKDVVWDLETKLGAINGTMDMSQLKVSKLDMDLGAGNLELILGSGYEKTEVDIDAGASKLDITVPEDAGVRIRAQGILSKTGLDGLNWRKDGNYYISPNYDQAKSRIEMNIDMGLGALSIKVAGKNPTV